MKILKRLTFLDWIIIVAFILTAGAAIYSLSPLDKDEQYIMSIYIDEKLKISEGDMCTDADSGKQLGEVSKASGNKFILTVKGKKAEHGIKVKRKIYLKNMPLGLYIGDFYAEAKVEGIDLDSRLD